MLSSPMSWQQRALIGCAQVNDTLEYQAKVILDRVETTRNNFGNLCRDFAGYTRKIAAIRDRGDELSRDLTLFTEAQSCCCPDTKKFVGEFANLLAILQDYEQARIYRLEAKVVSGYAKYGFLCHSVTEEVQKGLDIRQREQKQAEEYLRYSGDMNPNGPLRQHRLESANLAANDTKRAQELLQRRCDKFEQQKLDDTRRVLLNFCEIEIAFHAKAVEVFTEAYDGLRSINLEDDMETFRKELHIGPEYMRGCDSPERMQAVFEKAGTGDELNIPSTYEISKRDKYTDDEAKSTSQYSMTADETAPEDNNIVARLRGMENQDIRCATFFGSDGECTTDSNYAMAGTDNESRPASAASVSAKQTSSRLTTDRSRPQMSRSLLEDLATSRPRSRLLEVPSVTTGVSLRSKKSAPNLTCSISTHHAAGVAHGTPHFGTSESHSMGYNSRAKLEKGHISHTRPATASSTMVKPSQNLPQGSTQSLSPASATILGPRSSLRSQNETSSARSTSHRNPLPGTLGARSAHRASGEISSLGHGQAVPSQISEQRNVIASDANLSSNLAHGQQHASSSRMLSEQRSGHVSRATTPLKSARSLGSARSATSSPTVPLRAEHSSHSVSRAPALLSSSARDVPSRSIPSSSRSRNEASAARDGIDHQYSP